MADARHHLETGALDPLGGLQALPGRRQQILGPAEQEHGRLDAFQPIPDVPTQGAPDLMQVAMLGPVIAGHNLMVGTEDTVPGLQEAAAALFDKALEPRTSSPTRENISY